MSYVPWQWWIMQGLKSNWLASSKLTWGACTLRALENLKNVHCNGLLLTKVCKEAHSKYFSWRWSVMQYLKKNWLVIWKRTWGIWKIFVRNFRLKMSKLGLWWDPFVQSRKLMNWKITEELRVITSFILKLRTSSNEQ